MWTVRASVSLVFSVKFFVSLNRCCFLGGWGNDRFLVLEGLSLDFQRTRFDLGAHARFLRANVWFCRRSWFLFVCFYITLFVATHLSDFSFHYPVFSFVTFWLIFQWFSWLVSFRQLFNIFPALFITFGSCTGVIIFVLRLNTWLVRKALTCSRKKKTEVNLKYIYIKGSMSISKQICKFSCLFCLLTLSRLITLSHFLEFYNQSPPVLHLWLWLVHPCPPPTLVPHFFLLQCYAYFLKLHLCGLEKNYILEE